MNISPRRMSKVRTVPSTALLAPGEQLMAMLQDVSSDPEEMHAIVDAAIAGGELAYLGLTTARDRFGHNALHTAATRVARVLVNYD